MQQHPIPRNITGFQFKLIGDMTIKQFSYLAGGVVLGYLLFRILPLPGVLRLAAWLLFGGSGAALAFLPLGGRPLDVWIKAYVKSVSSPTQFVWKKQNPPPNILTAPIRSRQISQKTQQRPETQSKRGSAPVPQQSYVQAAAGQQLKVGNGKQETTEKMLKKRIRKELEQQYKEELERLKHEKEQVEKKMEKLTTVPGLDQTKQAPPVQERSRLRILSQDEATYAGFHSGVDQPNIIVGTIIDPQGQQLPGVLVTIKNRQGRIVRALKTNDLGQFISLTPLPNGEYLLEAEDPSERFKFDIIKTGLHGKVFPPIALIAKTQQESKQEEIRKKLFIKNKDA